MQRDKRYICVRARDVISMQRDKTRDVSSMQQDKTSERQMSSACSEIRREMSAACSKIRRQSDRCQQHAAREDVRTTDVSSMQREKTSEPQMSAACSEKTSAAASLSPRCRRLLGWQLFVLLCFFSRFSLHIFNASLLQVVLLQLWSRGGVIRWTQKLRCSSSAVNSELMKLFVSSFVKLL